MICLGTCCPSLAPRPYSFFSAQTLEERRENLCLKFALNNLKSENNMFTKFEPRLKTRNTKNIVIEQNATLKGTKHQVYPTLSRFSTRNRNRKSLSILTSTSVLPVDYGV